MTGEISGMAGRSRRRSVGYATPSGEIVTRRKWRGGRKWLVCCARQSLQAVAENAAFRAAYPRHGG